MNDYLEKRDAEISALSRRAQELYREMQSLDYEGLNFEHDEGMAWGRKYDALLTVKNAQMRMARSGYSQESEYRSSRSFEDYLAKIWPELAALPEHLRDV